MNCDEVRESLGLIVAVEEPLVAMIVRTWMGVEEGVD